MPGYEADYTEITIIAAYAVEYTVILESESETSCRLWYGAVYPAIAVSVLVYNHIGEDAPSGRDPLGVPGNLERKD